MMRRPQLNPAAILRRTIAAACCTSSISFSQNAVPHVPAGMYGGMTTPEDCAEQSKIRTAQLGGVLQMMDTLKSAGDASTSASKNGSESQITILYGSETGNAEEQAKALAADVKSRGLAVELAAMSDFDVARLPTISNLIIVCSTCGLGEFPANSRSLWKHLSDPNLPATLLSQTKFTVFGLGDSHYSQFCAAAAAFDVRLEELGATRVLRRGVGDDQAEEKFFSGWESWLPSLWKAFNAPAEPLQAKKPDAVYSVDIRDGGDVPLVPIDKLVPPVAVSAPTAPDCLSVKTAVKATAKTTKKTKSKLPSKPAAPRTVKQAKSDVAAVNKAIKLLAGMRSKLEGELRVLELPAWVKKTVKKLSLKNGDHVVSVLMAHLGAIPKLQIEQRKDGYYGERQTIRHLSYTWDNLPINVTHCNEDYTHLSYTFDIEIPDSEFYGSIVVSPFESEVSREALEMDMDNLPEKYWPMWLALVTSIIEKC